MKIFGIAGWSGSGKTTLVVSLIPILVGRGLRVSTMKHAHHSFEIDRPGKDSHRHRQSGATEVVVTSGERWVLMHELRDSPEPSIEALIEHMTPVDLLLIEGFKHQDHDKLEVHRAGLGKPLLFPEDRHIVAVASDNPIPDASVAVLDLNDVSAIADFVIAHCGLSAMAIG